MWAVDVKRTREPGSDAMQLNASMIKRACVIAAIVGPVLIAINQGAELASGAGLSYFKAALTIIVPFLVSLTSSVLSARERDAAKTDTAAPDETQVEASLEDARRVLEEILVNARKVNQASTERRIMLDGVLQSARRLQAELDDHATGVQARSVVEIVDALDAMRLEVDAALEGSATNIRLAEGSVGALRSGCREDA